MKKTVIVTGGAGFLGSHLVPALVEAGYGVHVIDSLVNGKAERLPKEATLHVLDIRKRGDLISLFEKIASEAGGIHGVFHLAALPSVPFSIEHPEEAHSVNVDGTVNVFDAARKARARRLVYSASSAAYGNPKELPAHEELVPQPLSPYGLHKYFVEHLARNYSLHYGLPTVSLRYFNIYGPGADPRGAYAQALIKFIDQRSKGQPITIVGDGLQTRDYIHARDVARANILALESDKVGAGEVINIGSGKNPSILDIARLVGGPTVNIAPRVEPRDSRADISKAKALLGWEPRVSLEEGISELKRLHGLTE